MPKRALIERRPWLLASLIAAIAYYLLKDRDFPGTYLYVIEVGAFALLATYALLRLGGDGARSLAAAMAAAGVGVAAVELDTYVGALLLILSHALVLSLLLRSRRNTPSGTQKAAAVALLVLVPAILWLATPDESLRLTVTIYGLAAGGMAGAAWISAFPRYRVGAGAVLVAGASLASILGAGLLRESPVPAHIAWPLFYLGHFLICTGIVQTLRKTVSSRSLRLVD